VSATDSDILVIYRDGFDVPYGDGTQEAPPQTAAIPDCPADPAAESLDDSNLFVFTVPATPAQAPIDTILVAHTRSTDAFRVERLNLDRSPWVRLVVIAQNGGERASAWVRTSSGAQLALATADAADGSHTLLLEGASTPLEMPLASGVQTAFLLQTQAAVNGVCQ
jgi:hypothetical protein